MHPQLLHHCSIISKNGSCCQLPESGPSEADRSRRGRRNMFVSRAHEPGSPPDLLFPPHLAHPSGAQLKRQQIGPADSYCLGSHSRKTSETRKSFRWGRGKDNPKHKCRPQDWPYSSTQGHRGDLQRFHQEAPTKQFGCDTYPSWSGPCSRSGCWGPARPKHGSMRKWPKTTCRFSQTPESRDVLEKEKKEKPGECYQQAVPFLSCITTEH